MREPRHNFLKPGEKLCPDKPHTGGRRMQIAPGPYRDLAQACGSISEACRRLGIKCSTWSGYAERRSSPPPEVLAKLNALAEEMKTARFEEKPKR